MLPKELLWKEVILAHLAREYDVQPNHPSSSPHGCEFEFFLIKNDVGASFTDCLLKNELLWTEWRAAHILLLVYILQIENS